VAPISDQLLHFRCYTAGEYVDDGFWFPSFRCSIQLSYAALAAAGFEPATFGLIEGTVVFATGEK